MRLSCAKFHGYNRSQIARARQRRFRADLAESLIVIILELSCCIKMLLICGHVIIPL